MRKSFGFLQSFRYHPCCAAENFLDDAPIIEYAEDELAEFHRYLIDTSYPPDFVGIKFCQEWCVCMYVRMYACKYVRMYANVYFYLACVCLYSLIYNAHISSIQPPLTATTCCTPRKTRPTGNCAILFANYTIFELNSLLNRSVTTAHMWKRPPMPASTSTASCMTSSAFDPDKISIHSSITFQLDQVRKCGRGQGPDTEAHV